MSMTVTIENACAATAHAPNHVYHEYAVKNNYVFGIPEPDLPLHYTHWVALSIKVISENNARPCVKK